MTENSKHTPMVSVDWLKKNLGNTDLVLLDCSLGQTVGGGTSEYSGKVIPGAIYFDLKNKFSDQTSSFPNTVPTAEQFESECRKLGISNDSLIVVYDNMGIYSSPRVWWLFQVMGHQNTFILDGGLPAWISAGMEVTDNYRHIAEAGSFTVEMNTSLVVSFEQVRENGVANEFTIVDARSEGRFKGISPEPRKELKSGRIPNSINLPYQVVLEDDHFKKPDDLKQLFDAGSAPDDSIVYSCGSGLTACIVLVAGLIAGRKSLRVYDGSWTEWAEKNGLFAE